MNLNYQYSPASSSKFSTLPHFPLLIFKALSKALAFSSDNHVAYVPIRIDNPDTMLDTICLKHGGKGVNGRHIVKKPIRIKKAYKILTFVFMINIDYTLIMV